MICSTLTAQTKTSNNTVKTGEESSSFHSLDPFTRNNKLIFGYRVNRNSKNKWKLVINNQKTKNEQYVS